MDYVKPVDVASAMVETGRRKIGMSPADCLIRGALAGSILAAATSLAITGTCLLYTSPSPRDRQKSRMPSSA